MKKIVLCCVVALTCLYSCKKDQVQAISSGSEETKMSDTLKLDLVDVAFSQPLARGMYRVIAGKAGNSAAVDGNGSQARFLSPSGIFVNTDASLLVADFHGYIRKIVHDSVVTTVPFPADGGGNPFNGATDVAAAADGTIAAVDGHEIWLDNPPTSYYAENPSENYGGIDRDPSGKTFWYTGKSSIFETSTLGGESPKALTVGDAKNFIAISTSNNGVKYFATVNKMFKYTKSGVSALIFPDFSFTNITSITSSRDGFKVYVADGGNIRMISNNSQFPKVITTILTGQQVVGIALSNSEKYIYFTTAKNTVNKFAL
ncbi:hypothetical protein IDJ77_14930 [Mucilaginibacter sp. ZT4R22]|uniref:Uncharacterized protein n=1 Tax=Mucilaginibacter pankratovii TaxID=2772110 RepID=A0ABR7WS29_9SPHI|nr:hypothetical protein [Mucilaginibacter pankratovii]MBD1365114.1 hypothetical protein [Mucilaginibacter pankratovii]